MNFSPTMLMLCILIASCTSAEIMTAKEFHFSSENNCDEQLAHLRGGENLSLYFFDSEGVYPEEMYQTSPSFKVKNQLRSDTSFFNFANETFDFIVFDQKCNSGKEKANSFQIMSFPTYLLISKSNEILYKGVGITTPRLLERQIESAQQTKEN